MSFTARIAYAQAPTVGSIIVQGNQRVEAETIRSYFRPGPDGQLDAFQIDEGVKTLISTGLFQDVRPTIQGGRLIITVTENPVINRIAFEGNKKVKDDQLKSEIQSKERGTLSRPTVQADTAPHRRGLPPRRPFRRARRTQDHRAPEQSRRSRLRNQRRRKDRGQAHPIRRQSLLFVLPAQGRDQDLRDRTLLAFLQTGDIYDPDRIEADRELLRRFYLKHGYHRRAHRLRACENTIRTAGVS